VFEPKLGRSPILGGQGSAAPLPSAPLVDPVTVPPLSGPASIDNIRETLSKTLSNAIGTGRVALVERDDGLVIRLRDAAFFEPGKAQVRNEVLADVRAVGQTLRGLENSIRIEGHTDPNPIRNSTFRSNWELSAARAASVLDELVRGSGIHESRMSIAGYASQRPIATNEDVAGRSQNRRVDIVVLDHGRTSP
jgi:chemotaxis protein MotB